MCYVVMNNCFISSSSGLSKAEKKAKGIRYRIIRGIAQVTALIYFGSTIFRFPATSSPAPSAPTSSKAYELHVKQHIEITILPYLSIQGFLS